MRILQVYMGPYLADRGGGVSVYIRNISERLVKRGHDVTVFATNTGDLPNYEIVNGVKVERFRCFAPGRAYFFSWDMLLRLMDVEFDVVHGHCYHAFPMHFAALAKCKRFVISTHFHGVGHSVFRDSLIKLLKPFGERTLEKADKIVAVSEYEKNLVVRQFELDSEKIVVIPAGVDLSEFEGLKRSERGFRSILYVGNLVDYKGVHYLVEVLPLLSSDIVLEIVGKGPLKPFLEKRARELGVFGRVRFYQDLPRQELLQKFAQANVFVLPSRYEAYSIVIAEALMARTPCIVNNTSALKEWCDEETCFSFDSFVDINKLAKFIEYILENKPSKDSAFKKWLRRKILDWEDVVERLEYVYFNSAK